MGLHVRPPIDKNVQISVKCWDRCTAGMIYVLPELLEGPVSTDATRSEVHIHQLDRLERQDFRKKTCRLLEAQLELATTKAQTDASARLDQNHINEARCRLAIVQHQAFSMHERQLEANFVADVDEFAVSDDIARLLFDPGAKYV